jgi:hypothetical protein
MRPLERIFRKPHRVAGKPHFPTNYDGHGCWWDGEGVVPLSAGRGFNMNVVGEAQWQDQIATIVGGDDAKKGIIATSLPSWCPMTISRTTATLSA